MARDLSRLLRPRHVAVFGGRWAENVVEQCRKMSFAGAIWPVHPTRETLGGLACFRSVAELPEAPDASFVGVNRHATLDVVAELAARGAGGAVCFASGFAEAEDGREAGAELQARLVAAAGDMPVLGPNCYGLINYLDGALLWPDQHGGRRVERGVAIVGQSSNMLISMTMQRRGLPLAYCIAAGNQAQTDLAEIALGLLDDARVSAIGLHIEGVRDLRAMEALASAARAAGKPIVALKVGRSALAQATAISHTASIVGGDAAGRAFLAQLGIALVDTLPEFLETLKFLHVHGPLAGREICSVSCSGGEASLIGDLAEGRRLSFRPFSPPEKQAVAATLGPLVTVSNPLDYHTFIWGDEAKMEAAFSAVTRSGFDLTVFILDFPRADRCDDAGWEPAIRAIAAAARAGGRPVAVAATLAENLPEARAEALLAAGLAPMMGLGETLAAAEAAAGIAEAWAKPVPAPVLSPAPGPATAEVLGEHAAKRALAAHGLSVPEAREAATREEAAAAAEALGFPVVLKGRGFAHKTEAGAVRLNLGTPAEVRAAAEAMAGADGFLVERMVEGAVAELILGVLRDPAFGYQLTIGAGGVLAELLSDSVTLPIPASPEEIGAALDGLRVAPLIAGWRGGAAGNREAIVEAALAVQSFAAAEAHRLAELDINPLIVTPEAAVAADALVRFGPAEAAPTRPPARTAPPPQSGTSVGVSSRGRLAHAPRDHPPIPPARVGVLLANLGTPDGTDYWSMRRYLSEFLSDRRVIEWPPALWQPILQGIVLTRRPFSSGEAYRGIWNEGLDESPLLMITRSQARKLRRRLEARFGGRVLVDFCMRYGNPSTDGALRRLKAEGAERIVFMPLYPQYAAPTTATANDHAFRTLMQMRWQPAIRSVPAYHDHPAYIEALARSVERACEGLEARPEVLVASYHGLPKSYLEKGDPYHCHCQKTTRLLRDRLGWAEGAIHTTFQSRFGPEEWLQPYTVEHVAALARNGIRRIGVIAPGFSSDCVETLEEIRGEIREAFEHAGGEQFHYIPCLNDDEAHIDMIEAIVLREAAGWLGAEPEPSRQPA